MNIIVITGRLCAEPEMKTTPSGVSVANVRIAVKRPMQKDATDFMTVLFWRQNAEYLCNYVHKGDLVEVSGWLVSREWEKDGEKRLSWEITCSNVSLLSSDRRGNDSNPAPAPANNKPAPQAQPQQVAMTPLGDDDLPF